MIDPDAPITVRQLARMLASHAAATSLAHAVREVEKSTRLPTRAELIDDLTDQFVTKAGLEGRLSRTSYVVRTDKFQRLARGAGRLADRFERVGRGDTG